jgi:ribonuclease BN (tRNA processing enzyme)
MDAALKLTVLGSSTPYPRPDNPCSGYLLEYSAAIDSPALETAPFDTAPIGSTTTTTIWVDAGTGTLAELQRHTSIADLDAIWISHAHADHTADLLTAYYALRFSELATANRVPRAGELATANRVPRAGELTTPNRAARAGELAPMRRIPLIGPPALAERLIAFLGPGAKKVLPEVFDIVEMDGWGETIIGAIDLSWGPVNHGMPAYALRADAGGVSVAYSGDTAPCTSLIELATGADALLCEVGYDRSPNDNAVHCTPEDAARIATEAGVNRLALTHLTGSLTRAEAERRAGEIFTGQILSAHPGLDLLRNSAR